MRLSDSIENRRWYANRLTLSFNRDGGEQALTLARTHIFGSPKPLWISHIQMLHGTKITYYFIWYSSLYAPFVRFIFFLSFIFEHIVYLCVYFYTDFLVIIVPFFCIKFFFIFFFLLLLLKHKIEVKTFVKGFVRHTKYMNEANRRRKTTELCHTIFGS